MPVFLATATKSGPRPFLTLDLEYRCPRCAGEAHRSEAPALVDSGATRASIPARFLPDHVAWEDLPAVGTTFTSAYRRNLTARLWHTDLRVLGTKIATEILVLEPGSDVFGYAVLGTGDLFEHFGVSFAFGNVPPVFSLERVGQVVDVPPGTALPTLPDVRIRHRLPELEGGHIELLITPPA